jgi:rod shape-determining protein MreC
MTTQVLEYLAISNVRIEKLEIEINQLKLENARLRDKLSIDTTRFESSEYRLLKATVVGRDPLNINGYLYIDKGTEHGIYMNQPVISIDGLVGRVKHAGPASSIVETVENKGFVASAIDVNTRVHGIVRKQRSLMFDYIRRTDSISVGDSILTSGMSELFPKGILIGTVQRVSESADLFFLLVHVAPTTQINRLVSVYIILDEHEASTSSSP